MTPAPAETPLPRDALDTEPSVGELLGRLLDQTGTLVRQEVTLASTEMTNKATLAARRAVFVAAGLLLGVVSLLVLAAALVLGLGTMFALWKSALVVGVALGVLAAFVGWKGLAALREMSAIPTQTLLSLREDKQWIQQQAR